MLQELDVTPATLRKWRTYSCTTETEANPLWSLTQSGARLEIMASWILFSPNLTKIWTPALSIQGNSCECCQLKNVPMANSLCLYSLPDNRKSFLVLLSNLFLFVQPAYLPSDTHTIFRSLEINTNSIGCWWECHDLYGLAINSVI